MPTLVGESNVVNIPALRLYQALVGQSALLIEGLTPQGWILSVYNDGWINTAGGISARDDIQSQKDIFAQRDVVAQRNVVARGDVFSRGVQLTCDKNSKENFSDVSSLQVLDKLASMPIQSWNYKDDPTSVRHIGPTAQDFQTAFGLNGEDDIHISSIDLQGVALGAIQGLNEKNEKLMAENAQLHANLAKLEARLSALEAKE
ncbi:tail fiber domain-containing protein [Paenibacillus mendelii]|uniref:Tail fiber domain-containing protein n=1 Tax=Paenibacillus mendelii TaxID=206163 RepID=A0ABV6J9V8_9BACL|nr:tail fiber domain-containing protein [Paenibacillus mendelii]MCQ6563988.1 tail fiber domain-containing protein [Paenibacillus mendelii]